MSSEHGVVTFAAADSGTSKDVLDIATERNLNVSDIVSSYSGAGTTEAVVTLYDEPAGTAQADVSAANRLHEVQLTPGDTDDEVGVTRAVVEDDVVAVVTGNDDEVSIIVSGEKV